MAEGHVYYIAYKDGTPCGYLSVQPEADDLYILQKIYILPRFQGVHAVAGIAEAKEWAWNEALHNDELTNMQLESVARGFASTPRADLAEPYAAKYFEVADWIWKNKTFHMAEALLEGLYPSYADPATLVDLGDAWLASHADADNALQRIVRGNVESSHRTLKVRDFNASL